MNKKNFMKILLLIIKYDGITLIFSILVLIFLSLYKKLNFNLVDWTIFSSIIILAILNSISKLINRFLSNIIEDEMKLSTDYSKIVNMYKESWIKNKLGTSIPIVEDYIIVDKEIVFDDTPSKKYQLPQIICENYSDIMSSHKTSLIYNQETIRVDDWYEEGNKFIIKTSRTTYFDSLVTNRAVDFTWSTGESIRTKFLYGPFFPKLKDSKLSNHLGFNGYIESSDGEIVFVKRSKNNSIGKRTYGNSIGASFKLKYAVKSTEDSLTFSGLRRAVISEIFDELKIEKDKIIKDSIKFISAYRDIVEGGKPQLLFYAKSSLTKEEISLNFKKAIDSKKFKKREIEELLLEDGKELKWIKVQELETITVFSDCIKLTRNDQDVKFEMTPSVASNMIMLQNYFRKPIVK